jgi:hypothetical protein
MKRRFNRPQRLVKTGQLIYCYQLMVLNQKDKERVARQTANGWLTPLLEKIVRAGTWLSVSIIIGSPYLSDEADIVVESNRRAKKVDTFIVICFLVSSFLIALIHIIAIEAVRYIAVLFFAWRISDVVCAAIRVILFDRISYPGKNRVVSTKARIVTLGFLNFIELGVCFGGIYSCFPQLIYSDHRDFLQAFHLSFISQITIGYGDVYPLGWLRPVTWLQGLSGIIILTLLVARYIGLLPTRGDSQP